MDISNYMIDNVDLKISEANPDLSDEENNIAPEIIREWNRQLELLKRNNI